MKKIEVAPSILSADFLHLDDEINRVLSLGCSYLHFDVMDGHFVNNISFGVPVLKSISKNKRMINDVHLMISDPRKFVIPFIEAGADIITFHLEALSSEEEVFDLINIIHEQNKKVGISIKPNTPVFALNKFLDSIDLVLVMSVEPGFGGQKFILNANDKIKELDEIRKNESFNYLIEVDGGINQDTIKEVKESGADIVVTGSYLFGSKDIESDYRKLVD